jgi:DNA mismatch repair protein MutL
VKIFQLPDQLANKIAAGEVVERPASVVKELIENSIDAGSTWIKIDIREAGLEQIKITDNGEGMSAEDCERAFLRHATSKIKHETDLFHIRTLGFRGEALASIASVSRLSIKTSQGEEAGLLLSLEGGKVIDKQKSDARKGTEILVEDLFFNTPARLKYMKTIHTELGHITDLLNRLALANPYIRFEATHNGKHLFKTAGAGEMLQVISQVYGMGVARKVLPVSHRTLDFSIEGYISKPEITRATRSYMSTIINGRYIRSIALTKAISKAYHTLLPIHRFPIVVLSIKMDPILVDVNVHPTKLEVRFSKERELFNAIEEMIKSKFRETSLIPELQQKTEKKEKTVQHSLDFNEITNHPQPMAQTYDQKIIHENNIPIPDLSTTMQQEIVVGDTINNEISPTDTDIVEVDEQVVQEKERIPTLYPIGQLQGTYILAQNENGLYMVDQHAAQERIKYEQFKEKLGKPVKHVQELLLPITFEFSQQETIFIEQYKDELEKVGLFLDSFGQQTYVVRSYPTWFPKNFEEEVIREMIEQIMEDEKVNVELIREEAAILMACKGSIKANHYLTDQDMAHLLEELRQTADPFTCPHGRPIIVHFSSYELEKMFKRVM